MNIQKYRSLVDTESKTMKSTDLHKFVFEATGKLKAIGDFNVKIKSVLSSHIDDGRMPSSLNANKTVAYYTMNEVQCNMILASVDITHLELMAEVFVAVKNNLSIFEDAIRTAELAKRGAELFGLKGNQALLSANRLAKNKTGVDIMKEMDIKLISETKEQILTPTEIGKILDPSLSGIAINKILQAFGFQEKVGKVWQPTEKGMEFAELLDTGKQHSDGTPVKQVKWKYSILKLIED